MCGIAGYSVGIESRVDRTLAAQALLAGIAERGADVITAPLSARPARAGMIQGVIGSLILTAFVIVIALPFGVGAAVYLEEYARDTPLTRFF